MAMRDPPTAVQSNGIADAVLRWIKRLKFKGRLVRRPADDPLFDLAQGVLAPESLPIEI
jgi:hypothetical protein